MSIGFNSNFSNYVEKTYAKSIVTNMNGKPGQMDEKGKDPKNGIMDVFQRSSNTDKAKEAEKIEKARQPELSEDAKKLLEELKTKYGNMDFFVASYSSEKEAQSYLSKGTKEISVLIDPQTLEEMAQDNKVREKYEGILGESGSKLKEMVEGLGEEKEKVKSVGISVDKEGNVSYFAQLDEAALRKMSQIKDFTDGLDKNNKEVAKAAEKAAEKRTRDTKEQWKADTFISATSIEELLKQIKEAKYENFKENDKVGQERPRFDMTL